MIKDELRFIGVRDFYKRCEMIKVAYGKMSSEEKEIYKFYVYSRRQLRECSCNVIWEFLNESVDSEFAKTKQRLYEETFKYRM